MGFFLFSLCITRASFAEGGAQFPVQTFLKDNTGRISQWSPWNRMYDAQWNRLFVFAKLGDSITSKNLNKPIVVYPNGDILTLSNTNTNTIQVNNTNCNDESCIFEYRLSNDASPNWDITVTDSNGNIKNGRMFAFGLAFESHSSFSSTLYILSDDGLIFQEKIREALPLVGFIIATKKGFVSTKGTNIGQSIYHSKEQGGTRFIHAYPKAQYVSIFPNYDMDDVCHKIFFNYPDEDFLSYLGFPDGPIPNSISHASFTKNTETDGGAITFETTQPRGRYQITIDFGEERQNVSFSGNINSTQTTVFWDGKDKLGNIVYKNEFTIVVSIISGETHFLNDDFESMGNGFVLTQMNGMNAGSDIVYYNNKPTTIDGYSISLAGDGLDKSDFGVSSSSTVLFSGTTDAKAFDMWVFQQDDIEYIYIGSKVDITVRKIWDDDNNRDSFRPDSIQFNLFCGAAECGDNPYTITEDTNWSITVPDIPIYDNNGQEYTYSVIELDVE